MKTTLLSLKAFFTICLLCLVGGVNVMADTYEVPFANSFKTKNESATINNHTWTLSKACTYAITSRDGVLQLGSGNKPMKDFSLTATDYKGIITKITVNAYAKNATSTLSISVGGVKFKGENTIPTQLGDMVFTGNAQGDIVLSINASKQFYLKSITIEYTSSTGVATPTITPASKTFSESFEATISCTDAAAKIYYTLDGKTPDAASTLYTTGVTITEKTTTLKAVAIKDGKASTVAEAEYTYIPPTPTIDQASKTFSKPFVATISCTDANAQIYYTLNGKDPDENSELYTETGVTIPEATTTLKAIAIKDGIKSEAIAEAVYTYVMPNAPITNTIWSEDWSSFSTDEKPSNGTNATYHYGSGTKLYFGKSDNYAGGEIPELLIKPKESLTIDVTSLKGYSGTLYFSFLTNKDESYFTVTSTTTDVKIGEPTKKGDNKYTYTITVPEGTEGLNLKLTNIESKNVRVDNLELYAVKTGSFTITPAQYGTYYTEDAFVMPEGVTGYTITEKNRESLTLNAAYPANEVVPAKTALLLKATEKPATNQEFTYTIVNSDEVAPAGNLLHGSVEATKTQVEGATAYYKLAQGEEGLGFYWANENGTAFTNGANKAYLAVKGNFSQMRGFSFESMTTGINNVVANTNNSKNAVIYDLNGRRVNSLNAAKGVYIVNGKKVIVK